MSNDVVLLHLTDVHYVTTESFNFHKLKNPLPVDEALKLLQPPELPNGVFKATIKSGTLCVNNYLPDGHTVVTVIAQNLLHPDQFLGVFTSIDEIKDTFPEYFI